MPGAPFCPRCGYDLSGLVASWTDSCPTSARCAECGLDFSCGNVLSPRLLGPGWSYEHALRPQAERFGRTSWVALRPWVLCSQLSVDHAIRTRRALRFAGLWLLGMHLAMVSVTGASWLISSMRGQGMLRHWIFMLEHEPWPTLGRVLRWVLVPYVEQIGVPTGPMSSVRFPVLPPFLIALGPTFLMPAWMAILGDTFAAAHVRRAHLVRGVAYSIPAAVAWSLLAIGLTVAAVALSGPWRGLAPLMAPAGLGLLIGFALFHALWWYLFIRRYLRLRHAGMTVLLFMVMSGLTLVVATAYYQWWNRRW